MINKDQISRYGVSTGATKCYAQYLNGQGDIYGGVQLSKIYNPPTSSLKQNY